MDDFHSKMSVCRHELVVQPPNPPTIPTLDILVATAWFHGQLQV